MNTGLHAIRWGAPRLAIALGSMLCLAVLAYAILIFAIVAVQAFGGS